MLKLDKSAAVRLSPRKLTARRLVGTLIFNRWTDYIRKCQIPNRISRFAPTDTRYPLTLCWVSIQILAVVLASCFCAFSADRDQDTGITVGQPKIWRYDRVYPLLDGMLRDIESTSIVPMNPLDPNSANLSYVDFLRTLMTLQVSYSQSAGLTNQVAQVQSNNQVKQSSLDGQYLETLKQQRNSSILQLDSALAAQSKAQDTVNLSPANSEQAAKASLELTAATAKVNSIQSRLNDLNSKITTAGSAGSGDAKFTEVDKTDISKAQPSNFAAFLDQLPDNVKKFVFGDTNKATLPVTKQMENQLALLNQRLAQQLSVIADDASRNGYSLYLFQFDVGLYPPKSAKNRIARVEFSFRQRGGEGGEPAAYAYSLTPGSSAYNIQQYIGRSQHFGITGVFNLLMGLGANAEYQRQHDQFRNGLVQSIYQSGFMDGDHGFGWHYGPNPFENFVSPGNQSSYALIAVRDNTSQLEFNVQKGWQDAGGHISRVQDSDQRAETRFVKLPVDKTPELHGLARTGRTLTIKGLAYRTVKVEVGDKSPSTDQTAAAAPLKQHNSNGSR